MYLQNLHTHSTYDDGRDTPREMADHAISLGFDSLGFSGHSYAPYGAAYSMSEEGTEAFKVEITRMKREYEGRIKLFLGLEFDMYSPTSLKGWDYTLGACHYLRLQGEIVGIDRKYADVKAVADKYFGGDGLALAKEYYSQLSRLPEYGQFDIAAHFDLIAKTTEQGFLFDTESARYRAIALECLEHLSRHIPFFEVNTGAIARGYRTSPYPDRYLLGKMREMGIKLTLSSDCHDKTKLTCHFTEALELIKSVGYDEIYVLADNGFTGVKI